MDLAIQFGLLVLGFAMLMKGADFFVDGAAGLAEKLGVSQLVIGLTIVAFGTSAPEAAVSITSALKGSAEITIGNVVGSNILNVLIVLGLTSLTIPIAVKKSTVCYEIPFVIFVSALLAVIGLSDEAVGFLDGIVLWVFMLVFLGYLLYMAKHTGETEQEQTQEKKGLLLLLFVMGGMILIVWGSDVAVDAATRIARSFGWSERLIGLTIVALGTSLPELMTSVTAGIKGNADIAVGNIVGSNIFNILFVVGTTALITPVAYRSSFFVDSLVSIFAVLLLWLLVIRKKRLGRLGGLLMLVCYGAYLAYLL